MIEFLSSLRLAATIAAATTGLAGILIILSLSIDKRACLGHLPAVQGVNIFQFISGISTIVFSFNGVGPLLVIQQDMKLIGDFRKAVIWGFLSECKHNYSNNKKE